MPDNKFGFGKVKENIKIMERELPVKLANQAQNFFVSSWKNDGWDGNKWETPKRRIPGTYEYKYPKNKDLGRRTRATLVKKARLRQAVSNSIRQATFSKVRLVVDLTYAAAQNEGTDKIPKRKYMGDSPILRKEQLKLIDKDFNRIWFK